LDAVCCEVGFVLEDDVRIKLLLGGYGDDVFLFQLEYPDPEGLIVGKTFVEFSVFEGGRFPMA